MKKNKKDKKGEETSKETERNKGGKRKGQKKKEGGRIWQTSVDTEKYRTSYQ